MTRPVVHFEIRGKDAARLQDFYRQLFGWEVNADNPLGYGFVSPGIGGPRGAALLRAGDALHFLEEMLRAPEPVPAGGGPGESGRGRCETPLYP